jgi:photosystem II stability/assembly factor-like uncharacterized protein
MVLSAVSSMFSQTWEKLRTVDGLLDNVVMNNNKELFFTGSYSDYNVYHVFKLKLNTDNPVDIYSSADTINQIFISKSNSILLFKGASVPLHEYRFLPKLKYYSTRTIVRSEDNGANWIETSIKIDGVTRIYEKEQGKIFLYGSHNDDNYCDSVIFFSNDDGISWNKIKWDYGKVKGLTSLNDGTVLASNDSVIFKSADNGISWSIHTKMNQKIDLTDLYENASGELFAKILVTGDNSTQPLFKSLDKGLTWSMIKLNVPNTQSDYYGSIINGNVIYAVDKNFKLFKSDNSGATWSLLNDLSDREYDPYRWSIKYISNKIIFISDGGSIFYYNEALNKNEILFSNKDNIKYYSIRDENLSFIQDVLGGNTLLRLENIELNNNQVTNELLSINESPELISYSIGSNNRIILQYIFNKYNGNQELIPIYSDNNALTFHQFADSSMYDMIFWGKNDSLYSTYGRTLTLSTDNGNTFAKVFDNIPIYPSIGGIGPNGYIYFFELGGNYAITTDKGKSWIKKYEYWFSEPSKIIFNTDGSIFYKNYFLFWRSTDNGTTWTKTADDCGDYNICDLEIHPDGNLYYLHNSTTFNRSTDNGLNWTQIYTFPDTRSQNGIKITNTGLIFATPYISSDNGTTWIDAKISGYVRSNSNGLTILNELNPLSGNKPVYYKFNKLSDVQTNNQNDGEFYISPNPALDFIEIPYPPLERGSGGVNIKIYNVFGQNVSTPVCSAATPASGGQRIDVSGLAPGMYFVQIGDKVQKFIKY